MVRPANLRPSSNNIGGKDALHAREDQQRARAARDLGSGRGRQLRPSGNVAQAAGPFTVPNPYAYGLSDDQIAINKLIAFGDSYSSLNCRPFPNWVEQLEAETNTNGAKEVKSVSDLAKSGATAGTYPER